MLSISRSIAAAVLMTASLQPLAWSADAHKFTPVRRDGHPYSVRITTGMHEISGWEQGLMKRDPTLRHWTWLPIYSYDQAYISAGRKRQPAPRPGHKYVQPNHIPLPVVSHLPPTVAPPRYMKPNKLPLPVVEHSVYLRPQTPQAAPITKQPFTDTNKNVAAVLRQPVERKERPAPALARTYGPYKAVYGRLRAPGYKSNALASTHLRGKLIAPKNNYRLATGTTGLCNNHGSPGNY